MRFTKYLIRILVALAAFFFLARFLAFGQIYHQDEYKWAMIVNPAFGLGLESEHPPLDALLYRAGGDVFGFDHLRIVPIIASAILFLFAFLICRRQYGVKAAWWTISILFVSVYEFIASTQIDIDGALLPLAGLLSIYCFLSIDTTELRTRANKLWIALFFLTVIAGFLIKLSYILFLGAIATEFIFVLYEKYGNKALKIFSFFVLGIISALTLAVLAVIAAKYVFNIRNVGEFLAHAQTFALFNFGARNYAELAFLTIKSIVFASPLMLLPYIFVFTKDALKKYRFWLIFLLYNFFFYFVIFDFTSRTIERYLMFLIVPSAIIAGSIIDGIISSIRQSDHANKHSSTGNIFGWSFVGVVLGSLPLLLRYDVLPLNPKSAFVERLMHLDFNFLIPFTGGSGPIGFYAPALYILWSFIISLGAIVCLKFMLFKNDTVKRGFLCIALIGVFLGAGFAYNAVFSAEFTGGFLYGSPDAVAREVVGAVVASSTIKQVITYNDIGGYELNKSSKYFKRFYTDPMFAETNKSKFGNYSGYYMVIDFPEIDKQGLYWKYLMTCRQDFKASDKTISGYIFDCKKGDSSILKAE